MSLVNFVCYGTSYGLSFDCGSGLTMLTVTREPLQAHTGNIYIQLIIPMMFQDEAFKKWQIKLNISKMIIIFFHITH